MATLRQRGKVKVLASLNFVEELDAQTSGKIAATPAFLAASRLGTSYPSSEGPAPGHDSRPGIPPSRITDARARTVTHRKGRCGSAPDCLPHFVGINSSPHVPAALAHSDDADRFRRLHCQQRFRNLYGRHTALRPARLLLGHLHRSDVGKESAGVVDLDDGRASGHGCVDYRFAIHL